MDSVYEHRKWWAISTPEHFSFHRTMQSGEEFVVFLDKSKYLDGYGDVDFIKISFCIYLECLDEYARYATDEEY